MIVFAHLGTDHWWSSLLYLLPVLIVVAGIGVTSWRDKRRGVSPEDPASPDDDPPTTTPGPAATP